MLNYMKEIYVDSDSIYLPDDYYDARYKKGDIVVHFIFIDINNQSTVNI